MTGRKKVQSNQKLENDLKKITEKNFTEVHNKNVEAAIKHAKNYESSSSDEDDQPNKEILQSVFKDYAGVDTDLVKTQQFLENTFQSGTAICLICIGSVKRTDTIWSCKCCYNFFHLHCIQRWANDNISQKLMSDSESTGYYNNLGEFIPKQKTEIYWDCPKCRKHYSKDEIPRYYECFCGKELNPQNHIWLLPHSCGQTCNKLLQPECGGLAKHKCLLLCHPGKCPPCPQTITISCKCNQSNPKTIRCSQKNWTCLLKCQLKLSCNIHTCNIKCHSKNECPPCKKRSIQNCLCGRKTEERNCSQLKWRCDNVCGKKLTCGLHICNQICHASECGDCPLTKPRKCPCGKQTFILPCTDEVDTCADTCMKILNCKIHRCMQRCHKGDCSQCLEIIEKKCRCGINSKELPCSKQYLCEIKCKQIRECKKHSCSRKCCDSCPSCDKICSKNLSCGKHKCRSLCHNGQCYPCDQKSQVKCRCGNTSITVPCGREKKTKPPKCLLLCKIPSKCHHENPHQCHLGECPMCSQVCGLKNDVTNCTHSCKSRCHDYVKVLISDKNFKPTGPWEIKQEIYDFKKLPHPQCEIKIAVSCLGGHDVGLWPCYSSKPSSCGQLCNRKLKCGNHTCDLICHEVQNLQSITEENNCSPCNRECELKRSCLHPCKKQCHPSPCDLCNVNIKSPCHCGLTQTNYKCSEFFNKEMINEEDLKNIEDAKEKVLSCGDRCIKNYSCGHRCTSICHSGQCPNPEICKKKIKVLCTCKNRKIEVSCDKVRSGTFIVQCNEICEVKKQEQEELSRKKILELEQVELEKNRIEMELFEKKFGKKKFKQRKQNLIDKRPDRTWLYVVTGAFLVVIISLLIYFFILN